MKLLHDLEVRNSNEPHQNQKKLKIKMLKSQRLKQGLYREPKDNLTMKNAQKQNTSLGFY